MITITTIRIITITADRTITTIRTILRIIGIASLHRWST
jgi:hypothetical protein